MSDSSEFDRVLEDWSSVVDRPTQEERNELLDEKFPELEELLRTATLVDVSELAENAFGGVGWAIRRLNDKQFLWLLPVLLRFGHLSEEPGYAGPLVMQLIESIPRLRKWPRIKEQLSPETLEWLNAMSDKCIRIQWEDERRITKRGNACREIFEP